jgi:hypothetical protein
MLPTQARLGAMGPEVSLLAGDAQGGTPCFPPQAPDTRLHSGVDACTGDRASPSAGSAAEEPTPATTALPRGPSPDEAVSAMPFLMGEEALLRLEAGLRAQREKLRVPPQRDPARDREQSRDKEGAALSAPCGPRRIWFYMLDTAEDLPHAPQLKAVAPLVPAPQVGEKETKHPSLRDFLS